MNHNQFIFCLVLIGLVCLLGAGITIYHHCSKTKSDSEKVVMGVMNSISTGIVCLKVNNGEFYTWLSCEVRSANGKAIKVDSIVVTDNDSSYDAKHVWQVNPDKHLIHLQTIEYVDKVKSEKHFYDSYVKYLTDRGFTERKDLNDLLGLQ